MKFNKKAIPYYSFESLNNLGFVNNAFTSKEWYPDGMDGKPAYDLKVYWRPGEDIDEITETNRVFLEQLGASVDKLVTVNQKHTANIHVATKEDVGQSLLRDKFLFTDGIVTNVPGAVLVIDVADCTPLFFADPVNKAVGIAHAGRKGTQQHIDQEVIAAMMREYGSKPEDIIACIGPSICQECYEVGDDVGEEFWEDWSKGFIMGQAAGFAKEDVMKRMGVKYHIDIWEANRLSLIEAGVKPENIEVSGICTRCNKDRFYSFRGDGGIINENAGYISIKE